MIDLLCDTVLCLALLFAGFGVIGLLLGIVATAGVAITDGLRGRDRLIETLK